MADSQNDHVPMGVPYATYDTSADIVYIYLRPIPSGTQRRSVAALNQALWIDLDGEGEILGIEIPGAAKRVPTLMRSAAIIPAPAAVLRIEPTDIAASTTSSPTGRLDRLDSDAITRILGFDPKQVDNGSLWGFLANKQVCAVWTTVHRVVVTRGHSDVFVTLFGDRYRSDLEGRL